MKIRYCRLCIFQILHRLPRSLRNVVPDPIDKVPDLPPEDLGVHNFADLELREAIHVEEGGIFSTRPGNVFATCGSRRLTWKTGWMCMEGGRSSRKEEVPTGLIIGKGPRRRTSSLEEGRVVEMLRRRSHTLWPGRSVGAGRRRRLAKVSMAFRALRSSL